MNVCVRLGTYLTVCSRSCLSSVRIMIELDPDGPVPLYVQVADIIAARIEAGDLQPDKPIPSEKQLVDEFGIARGTARRTVDLLRERGLVYTVPHRGTFVKKP
jgi:GntR family transcriptional regulator